MQRIKVTFSYDGTFFSGFQRQQNADRTVQQVFEDVYEKTFNEAISLQASGRTDAGVHAHAQVAHFDTTGSVPVSRMVYAMNRHLPEDMVLAEAEVVDPGFHARKSALGKAYSYYIHNGRIPRAVGYPYVVHIPQKLDVSLFEMVLERITGTHCFRGFCARGTSVQTFERTILTAQLLRRGDIWRVYFIGNGFLRKMVRNIVGTALDIATHQKPWEILERALASGQRCEAGRTAPAKGLFLDRVYYDAQGLSDAVTAAKTANAEKGCDSTHWLMPMP